MDEHTRRVTQSIGASWAAFLDGGVTLLDVSGSFAMTAEALDDSHPGLPQLLRGTAIELEAIYFTNVEQDHEDLARPLAVPLIDRLTDE